MKEDVLEQIVDDYLQHLGYFTMHNIRFRPDAEHPRWDKHKDSVYSDVDVVGYNPSRRGPGRVMVVSCKSWQSGFSADLWLAKLNGGAKQGRKEAWKYLREVWDDKWAQAFRARVFELTGATRFTYAIAVTRLRGNASAWATDPVVQERLGGNPIVFLTLEEMWQRILSDTAKTPAASEIGRLAQVLKASGVVSVTEQAGPPVPKEK